MSGLQLIMNRFFEKRFVFLMFFLGLIIFDGYRILIGNLLSIKPFLLIAIFVVMWASVRPLYIPVKFRWYCLWYISLLIPLAFNSVLSVSQYIVIMSGHALLTFFLVGGYNFLIYQKTKLIDIYDVVILLGVIVALVGFAQTILFFLGVEVGVSHFHDIGVPRPESFFSETDWHAMFVGYCLLASVFVPPHSRFSRFQRYIFTFLLVSLITSFGRTAIAGTIVAFGIYLLCFVSFSKLVSNGIKAIVVAVPLLFLTFPFLPDSVVSRFNVVENLVNPELDAGAINSRLFAIKMTTDFIAERPLRGNGAGSLNYLAYDEDVRQEYAYGGGINSGRGGTNIFLTSLFDAGIFGLLVMVGFWVAIIRVSYQFAKNSSSEIQYFFKFCFLSIIFFLVECQANNMIRTPICWLTFIFFSYAVHIVRNKRTLILRGAV